MGSSHEFPNRRKRRNSDCITNYVDRVRICDTKSIDSESIYSKANSQKTGWRQKSLSNIDLSLSYKEYQPGAGAFRYRDFEAHDDLCINNTKNTDYEEICSINPKAQGQKRDLIHEHNKVHLKPHESPKVCSLRRSKSLAVIREETFNELAPSETKSRRSQLIPRAKLIDRNFFRDRISFPLDETFSNIDQAIDNECKKSNSHYSWQCDRSDLGSIDSSIFKHSLHQSSLEKSNSLRTDSTKIISSAEIHNESRNYNENLNSSSTTLNIKEDSGSGITIIEIKDQKQFYGPTSSVISYDSIYLSSESDKQTVLGENVDNIDDKIKDFEEIIRELNVSDSGKAAESIIDNLYSHVGKRKAEIVGVELKINSNTDYLRKGALECLTGIVNENVTKLPAQANLTELKYSSLPDAGISKLLRDCELIDANLRDDVSVELLEPYPDYDSLPNEPSHKVEDESPIDLTEQQEAEKFVADKTFSDPISLEENPKGAPSIELVQLPTRELIEEQNESSQSEIFKNNTTKIYLSDIGVELDYENSIVSFESDQEFELPPSQPLLDLVTISGRKVIVDELAAKDEQKADNKREHSEISAYTGKVVKKVITGDNENIGEKIKLSECKQRDIESSCDKKILFHLNEKSCETQSEVESKSYRFLRRNCLSFNMPRPQLLSIVDSKNSIPKKDNHHHHQPRRAESRFESDKAGAINQEFLHKVDSVRTYWSKMLDDEERTSNLKQMSKNFLSTKSSNDIPDSINNEEFQSFFPTVEIVELNGETQATLVTSRKLNDVEFDHVRYKVMKSDMFQKNLIVSNNNQFDGLMQYLQDYSFQELLANNNVVIIEPVRTKIEKVTEKPDQAQSATCKITNGALNRNGSNNLRKHFFYQPIRVNKELYEEELPVPDTVRNVRKLFEGSLTRDTFTKVNVDSKLAETDNMRRKTIRYLTIDTSLDNNSNLTAASKWDSISLSSGVSSAADLHSPCECQDNASNGKFISSDKENLENFADENGVLNKSHLVSDDVLEKIRECGSSITYYGEQASTKKFNSDIMREIGNNQKQCNCQIRRPRHSRSNDKSIRKQNSEYSGLKFKLVKSNSCSSRLELTGTGIEKENVSEEMRKIIHTSSNDKQEESVKHMISKLESKNAVIFPSKPRIIESKCIEKVFSPKASFEKEVTTSPSETANNQMNSGSNHPHDELEAKQMKVVRNKNVDLALASVTGRHKHLKNPKSYFGDTENLAQKESLSEMPAKWSSICKMDSVEMVKNQDEINIKGHHPILSSILKPTQKSTKLNGDEKVVKMMNWSTVGCPLGKEYIANDRNLIETKIYDEMEFEEFEVMGEQHYDSLNSK